MAFSPSTRKRTDRDQNRNEPKLKKSRIPLSSRSSPDHSLPVDTTSEPAALISSSSSFCDEMDTSALHPAYHPGPLDETPLPTESSLPMACSTQHLRGLENFVTANSGSFTPLHQASSLGLVNVVEMLLTTGVDLNKQTKNGETPLWLASANGHHIIVEMLIAAGANIEAPDSQSWTPLFIASLNGHGEVVDILLMAGTDSSKCGMIPLPMEGYISLIMCSSTPLLIASQRGHLSVVERLIEAGAKVDTPNSMLACPLYMACYQGHQEVASRLLAALTTVTLRRRVGTAGIGVLARALKSTSTVTGLHLVGCPSDASEMWDLFRNNCRITSLTLSGHIQDSGAIEIALALQHNSTLTILNLEGNYIHTSGAASLATALKVNSTLTTLNLSANPLFNDGALALASALRSNSTLTTLHLRHIQSYSAGICGLAAAIQQNSSLTTLDLRQNQADDLGGLAFAEALRQNCTLSTLFLKNNQIRRPGKSAIAASIHYNTSLTSLDLYFRPRLQVSDYLDRNITNLVKKSISLYDLLLQNL